MALHTKAEFSRACGVSTGYIATNISRKKIILSGDYVDDSIRDNAEFILKCKQKAEKRTAIPVPESPKLPTSFNKKKALCDPPDGNGGLEATKTTQQIEKMREEIEILKVKKEKLYGQVVPTSDIKILFAQHTKSILVEYSNSVDKILLKIAKRKSLTNEEVSEIKKEMIDEINLATENALNESKKNLRNLITDFSQQRDIGERS
jgi:hypothetical protein